MKFSSLIFSDSQKYGEYALVVVRLAIGMLWLYAVLPRWAMVAASQPLTEGLVARLFGANMSAPLTIFFTILETLGGIALIAGFATRLAAVWAVVEFAITGTLGVLIGNIGLMKDIGLMAAGLVLLVYGSQTLSIDGLILKRMASNEFS